MGPALGQPPLPDPEKVGEEYRNVTTVWAVQMTEDFEVPTLEGAMHGYAGDYLFKGASGQCWPMARARFESMYVKVR